MMLNRIALIASLLAILFGTNVYADTPSSIKSEHSRLSQSLIIKASKAETKTTLKQNQTAAAEIKKAEPTIKSYALPTIVGLFILLLFSGYWFVFRRKLFAK